SAAEVVEDRPLQELGLDSLMAVELRNALGKRAGATLPATLAFDYPTPAAITGYLLDKVLSRNDAAVTASAPVAPTARSVDEPIAIVGLGCRYPGGVSDPASLWRLLEAGGDGVIDVPPERWDADALYDPDPDAAGKTTCRSGGFLRNIDGFDANFFGISPREATSMDPQQRLLLETSWEALERAGFAPDRLVGSSTGVFVGLMYQEYAMRAVAGGLEQLDGYVGMGTAASIAAGRISYTLGLQGPCMTVDTACSSSLVTAHLACQALRQGECSLALAGGVAMMLMPTVFVEFSRLRGLSPDGRCKSFSAQANGVGWAEGCGMLVLERLSDAQRHGHPVLAVIRGSAVNQDGRSNGLTAPNGPAQEAVIRRALAQAGVRPADVQYVECHGTGTSLGDPIEVQALGAVLAEGRDADRPAWIGSIKSNLGHTQAAAGAAGIMKVVLALEHERIPRNIHFDTPSPHIAWDELPVTVVAKDMPWPRNGVRRIAGVSSFGVSGTNAHVVIEEAPVALAARAMPARAAETRAAELIVLSGRSAAAVDANAERLAQHLEAHPEQALGDVACSLAASRSHHEHRLSLVVENREALIAALGAVASGERPAGSVRGQVQRGKTAWLFSGQGSQVVGMGRALADAWPVFREALDAAIEALDRELDPPLREVMWEGTEQALSQTAYTQPALFAVETALAALWRSWGAEPDVLIGHSIGELSAAYVAGVFSLEDAARLVAARGRLMQALPGGGAMWSIAVPEADVVAAIAADPDADAVSIGAVNGPASVVISGDDEPVARIAARFAARGVRTRRLEVSHAFHSARMDAMLEAFEAVASTVMYRVPERLLVSNVSGALVSAEVATAAYWVRHVRAAVRFADGVKALAAAGVTRYLELGPRATLAGLVPACLGPEASPVVLASLRPDRSEPVSILEALGGHHASGGAVDWARLWPTGARVELPTYAWQRQRYWIEDTSAPRRAGEPTEHPLLGVHVALAGSAMVYETVLSRREHAWLYDHRVAGQAVVPGAGLVELVRAAGEHRLDSPAEAVSLVLQAPLVLPERGGQRVQVVLAEDGARLEASVYSQPEQSDGAGWRLHATAEVCPATGTSANAIDLAAVRSRCTAAIAVETIYERFAATGLAHGPAFRGLQALWGGRGEALAELALPDGIGGDEVGDYGVHPALLDSAFQASQALADGAASELVLPFAIDRLVVHEPGARRAFAHVRRSEPGAGASADSVSIDVTLADAHGRVLVELLGLHGRRADAQAIGGRATDGAVAQARYRIAWPAAGAGTGKRSEGAWLVVGRGDDALARALVAQLSAAGTPCTQVTPDALAGALPAAQVVCVWGAPPDASADAAANASSDVEAARAQQIASEGLALVQCLAQQRTPTRVWWVTQGAVCVDGDRTANVPLSTLWGLGRTVMQEHPELGCTLVDAPAGDASEAASAVVRELGAGDDEREIAWRGGTRRVARLVRAAQDEPAPWLPRDGAVLITGGLGALGMHVARWLAGRGVRHLVLTGRRGRQTPGAEAAIAELEALGARVTVAAVDVADRTAVAAMLADVAAAGSLRGVIHTAGVLDDGVLGEQSAARFAGVLGPKLTGALHLDALTRGLDLDFVVLFSSTAGTLGAAGQAPYAAANAALDALAAARRARGEVGQSLAWGAWSESGMAAQLGAMHQARLARQGIQAWTPAQGVAALASVLRRPEPQLVLLPLDLSAAKKTFGASVPPVWRALVRASRRAAARGGWADEIAALPAARRRGAISEVVRQEIARVLALGSAAEVVEDRPLQELGLDSLMAVELRNALGKRAGAT
ncbi:MAG TPA: SDR family NAD(P)-dependent oxidoreductase, partial [Kofleriaceae bacterium]|nr:SDR family NAD(P)-dependent oxidoreductase [Kofleriaceae bacterium]